MPRVKQSEEDMEIELRITPCDGLPIDDWKLSDDHKEFIAFQEGDDSKKLHYHCYLKYARSRTLLTKWIYSIAHCNNGETGNTVFFSRKPHEHTFGYISKCNNVAVRKNIDDQFITQWFNQSEEYRKSKERDRKRKQRSRQSVMMEVIEHVRKGLEQREVERSVGGIVHRTIAECSNQSISLPTRNEMDRLVISLLAPYDKSLVASYYLKNFQFL